MEFLYTYEFWTAVGTVGAAVAAAVAAIMSYRQVQLVRSADVVASLYFVGNLNLALQVTNHGGVARRVSITYKQVSGPRTIQLVEPKAAIINEIDVLDRSATRSWEIGKVLNSQVFTQDYQRGALALDLEETRSFEGPFKLQVDIGWDEPGIKRRRSDSFTLIADTDLFNRSPKQQVFPGLPKVG